MSMTAVATAPAKGYEVPFRVEIRDTSETSKHSEIKYYVGQKVLVREVKDTPKGKAFRFKTSIGELQIMERLTLRIA